MNDEISNKNVPSIIVVSDSSTQRLAFTQSLRDLGYNIIDCIPYEKLNSCIHKTCDLWLIDTENVVDAINELPEHVNYLVGFTPAPRLTEIKKFQRWQVKLKRKLESRFGKLEISTPITLNNGIVRRNWDCLLVLGASLGGPKAVKIFLDNLDHKLPIAVILAQHIDKIAIKNLPNILTLHNGWTSAVVNKNAQLQSGHVWIVSPDYCVDFNVSGWILNTQEAWSTEYKPSIGQTMKHASYVFSKRVINIVFSGMGDDGLSDSKHLIENNSKIWVQSPASCQCDSQPNAMISSGLVSYVGDPLELAKKVNEKVQDHLKTKSTVS